MRGPQQIRPCNPGPRGGTTAVAGPVPSTPTSSAALGATDIAHRGRDAPPRRGVEDGWGRHAGCARSAPGLVIGRLCGCKDLHESVAHDAAREVVGAGEMAVEGGGVELREDVDFVDAAVDAVGHGDVYEAVRAADRHGGLCA